MTRTGNKVCIIAVALIILTGAIGAAITSESLNPRVRQKRRNQCLNNLNIIHSTVISAALAGSYARGDTIPVKRITEYLKNGEIPLCPSGGRHTIPPVGDIPVCSHNGNIMDREGLLKSAQESAIPEAR